MNLSVDIAGRNNMGGNQILNPNLGPINQYGQTGRKGIGVKKHSQARDYGLRMSKANDEKLLNHSVHDFGSSKKPGSIDLSLQELSVGNGHHHSKSLMKSPMEELMVLDKKGLEKKRYD